MFCYNAENPKHDQEMEGWLNYFKKKSQLPQNLQIGPILHPAPSLPVLYFRPLQAPKTLTSREYIHLLLSGMRLDFKIQR